MLRAAAFGLKRVPCAPDVFAEVPAFPCPPVPLPGSNFFLDEKFRPAYSDSWVKLWPNPGTPASLLAFLLS